MPNFFRNHSVYNKWNLVNSLLFLTFFFLLKFIIKEFKYNLVSMIDLRLAKFLKLGN